MPRRKQFTIDDMRALKPKKGQVRTAYPDPLLPGHYIRSGNRGNRSYVIVSGRWLDVGLVDAFKDAEAVRARATEIARRARAGESIADPEDYETVANNWLTRHCEKKGLRSRDNFESYLRLHVYPAFRGRHFESIKRVDVAHLLDRVEDKSGPVAADRVLAIVSSIGNWYAARHNEYVSPVVKGMRRSNPTERAGERVLTDDELRLIWRQAEQNGVFGAFIRLALLTAQRREKVASMRWQDISPDGVWTVPAEAREKGNIGRVQLPAVALDIIRTQHEVVDNPYVFAASRGSGYVTGYSKLKKAFDKKFAGENIPDWDIHDLRRTARSLLSRAKVDSRHAERVLGHSLRGVEKVYDRFAYFDEKSEALAALADLILGIVGGSSVPTTAALAVKTPWAGKRRARRH